MTKRRGRERRRGAPTTPGREVCEVYTLFADTNTVSLKKELHLKLSIQFRCIRLIFLRSGTPTKDVEKVDKAEKRKAMVSFQS